MQRRLLALAAVALMGFCTAQGSILEVLASDDRFETLVTAVNAAGLVDTLNGPGPLTLFAPTDRAFHRIAELSILLAEPETLRRILLLHVVPGDERASRLAASAPLATALPGAELDVRVVEGTLYVGDAIVTVTDVEGSNGVVHVIDTVLTPPAE